MSFACLTYHVIGKGKDQYTVTESQLGGQLELLTHAGYVVDDFEQLELALKSARQIPSRYVLLTIDDGHESSMRAADLLQANGCRGTFFVTRDRCLSGCHSIRKAQIRELRKAGFSIGTHGATHRKLTFMPPGACAAELNESKWWLEDVLGENVRYMAAPGGYINKRVLRLAEECGYTLTGTCREWMNSSDKMRLPSKVNRVNIRQHFSLRAFRQAVEGNAGFYFWRQVRSAALAVPKRMLR